MLCIGALPFLNYARVYAGEDTRIEDEEVLTSMPVSTESKWLDDYHRHIGFTYGADVTLNANYLWRGLYAGGLCLQPSANVGYGGLYAKMWWSVGTTDWAFTRFQPEFDFIVGFARWGLDATLVYIHNFNCGFFDFHNYPDHGNVLELDLRYTVSSKLPLSILWATRLSAADGYLNAAGDTVRAYSTYIELSYTHRFPYDIRLYGGIGITPWRSLYTLFEQDFGVVNIDIRLRKDWSLSEHCGMMLQAQFAMNPSRLAADLSTAEWHPSNPHRQSINANIGLGFYLK